MPATYEPISTISADGSSLTVTFSSIPATYTDLVIVMTGKTSSGSGTTMRFNSDTGTNYSQTTLSGNGTTASAYRQSNASYILCDYDGYANNTNNNISIFNIMNYANTTTNKTVLCRANNAAIGTDLVVGVWRSTAAITTITIAQPATNNWSVGSIFTLYGIKAA